MAEVLSPPPIREAVTFRDSLLLTPTWVRWMDLMRQQSGTPGPTGPAGPTGPQGPPGDPATGPSDEQIQDLMATTMHDSPHINWTYNDTLNYLSCDLFGSSVGTADLTNDAVTYAKIQNVTDNRLLGRSAGSAGDVQELTVGTGLSLSAGVLTNTGQPLTVDRSVPTVNGAASLTATALAPTGARIEAVLARIDTTFSAAGGLTAIQVGDSVLQDGWGQVGLTAGLTTTPEMMRRGDSPCVTSAYTVRLSAIGGTFAATGSLTLRIVYTTVQAW